MTNLPPYARPISATFLGHFATTPADGLYYWTAPRERKTVFDIGNAIHAMGLKGKAFEDLKIVVQQEDGRTAAEKARKAAAIASESMYLTPDDVSVVKEQGANLASYMAEFHPTTVNEQKFEWLCQLTGLPCIGFIDAFDELGLFDIKTSQDCSPADMRIIVRTFNTGIKFAHYEAGLVANGFPTPAYWSVIIVGKTAPYGIQEYIFAATERAYWQQKYAEKMAELKQCIDTDTWPKYAPYGVPIEYSSYNRY